MNEENSTLITIIFLSKIHKDKNKTKQKTKQVQFQKSYQTKTKKNKAQGISKTIHTFKNNKKRRVNI